MSAATFVLTINLFIAAIFAVSFGVVAAYQKTSDAARWQSAAYGLGVFNVVLEFILPFQEDPRLVGIAIFLDFLLATLLIVVGLARHYRQPVPWRVLGGILAVSTVTILVIIDWPRGSFARMVLYQAPYAAVMTVGAWVILRHKAKRALDLILGGLFILSALQFLAKPLLAAAIGSGASPQDYINSTYAAISQTAGAFLLIANGLLILLILVRNLMEEMTARSETDKLSGLFNRRGFDDRVGPGIATLRRTGMPGTMIIADLDNFKAINDTHGHECGDAVIVAFARLLKESAGEHFIVGRLGGEEFGVFMPGVEASGARLLAENVRTRFAALVFPFSASLRTTVSMGVSQIEPGDSHSDALRRADGALYQAKREGRNRVQVASYSDDVMPEHPMERLASR
ncbi:GGDEF domain-containing protein [Devosia nitrariae]|uniref:diguanylate cyclase n=1 Tax=Devosia nitrariae TaxID=2071872 RepID=A0ABQ5W3I1_9HYPH|nr:GGDEF domain-containing protein [Devosia nitrariae]GLQ54480.1 GGDEF domain-containing protein [Devosia nitrariae]